MSDYIALWLRHVRIALFTAVLLIPCVARAAFDLTGDWLIHSEYFETGIYHIEQDGVSLEFEGLRGSIAPDTGSFRVTLRATSCSAPFGIYAQATDNDHFSGIVGGFWDPLYGPCRVAGGQSIVGERVGLSSTPTPTETRAPPTATTTPLLCTGDCDGSGRTTIAEVIASVRCSLRVTTRIEEPCACLDLDGSGSISVNELVGAVNSLLRGCPR